MSYGSERFILMQMAIDNVIAAIGDIDSSDHNVKITLNILVTILNNSVYSVTKLARIAIISILSGG